MASGSLKLYLSANSERLTQELSKAKKSVSNFSSKATKALNKFRGEMALVSAAAAAGFAVMVKSAIKSGNEIAIFSQQLGISTEALSQWGYAAKTVGFEGDKMADIFKDVSEKIGDAFLNNAGEAKEALDRLGIPIREIVKLSPDQQLLKIAESLGKIDTQSGKIQIMEALANDASRLIPLLSDNSAELKKLTDRFNELGGPITKLEADKLKKANQAILDFNTSISILANSLAIELTDEISSIADFIGSTLTPVIKTVTEIFKTLAIVAAGTFATINQGLSGSLDGMKSVIDSMSNDLDELYNKATTPPVVQIPASEIIGSRDDFEKERLAQHLYNVRENERQIKKVKDEYRRIELAEEFSKYANIASGLKNLTGIIAKQGKVAFFAHKALAVTEAGINTAKAVTAALPNFPLAFAVGAAGAAQIASIIAASPGGSVGGGSVPSSAPTSINNDPVKEVQEIQQPLPVNNIVIQLGNKTLAEVVVEGNRIAQDNDMQAFQTENGYERVIIA